VEQKLSICRAAIRARRNAMSAAFCLITRRVRVKYFTGILAAPRWLMRTLRYRSRRTNIYRRFYRSSGRYARIATKSERFFIMFRRALKCHLALPLCPPYPGGQQTAHNWDGTSAAPMFRCQRFPFLFFFQPPDHNNHVQCNLPISVRFPLFLFTCCQN